MKTIAQYWKRSGLLLIIGVLLSACVKDGDFNPPPVSFEEPQITADYTIQDLKEIYGGFEPKRIGIEGDTVAKYVSGYVISDDETGNLYKTLVIQDNPKNPTAGIAIATEAADTYLKVDMGRKIYFRVDGLYTGEVAGLPTLGTQGDEDVGRIGVLEFEDRLKRTGHIERLIPRLMTIDSLSEETLNMLIELEDVEFAADELATGEGHYGNLGNNYSVNRTIEDCDGNNIYLRTSGYANFKDQPLPEGKGVLTAIHSIFGNTNQLFIRNTNDVKFEGTRCE